MADGTDGSWSTPGRRRARPLEAPSSALQLTWADLDARGRGLAVAAGGLVAATIFGIAGLGLLVALSAAATAAGLGVVAWARRGEAVAALRHPAPSTGVLLRVRGSHLGTREVRPPTLDVYDDRIEAVDRGFLTTDAQTIRYSRVARVEVRRGVWWSALAIESTGGGVFLARGLRNADAEHARREIELRVARDDLAARDAAAAAVLRASPPAERLARLDALRASGAITGPEHAAQRARILADL
jgi:hypothetical protein